MPTQAVIDINDPLNQDAWGLHPVPSGRWTPGNYAQGSVATFNGTIWFANVQTNATPGTDSTWTSLIPETLTGVALDTQGFVPLSNMPITRGQALRALRANAGTGGAVWPAAGNWLKIVEAALPADEGDPNVIAWSDAFWPIGGTMWSFVQAALVAYFSAFSGAQLAALQSYAVANR
jgi:hypothetical protein